jgi:hypothetical protein
MVILLPSGAMIVRETVSRRSYCAPHWKAVNGNLGALGELTDSLGEGASGFPDGS